jgi:hypothetical protein
MKTQLIFIFILMIIAGSGGFVAGKSARYSRIIDLEFSFDEAEMIYKYRLWRVLLVLGAGIIVGFGAGIAFFMLITP